MRLSDNRGYSVKSAVSRCNASGRGTCDLQLHFERTSRKQQLRTMSSDRREFFRFKDITKEKKRCGVEGCPSRRLHFDETGVAVCENGHQHPEIDRPDEDDDDYASSQGRTTRKARERVEKPVQRRLNSMKMS